jgi:hypothetical protein
LTAALGSLALAVAQPAAAKTPCWRQVINDWDDNHHIDGTYSQQCYREAIANVPADLAAYTSIVDDIVAASRQVLRTTQVYRGSNSRSANNHTTRKKTATRSAPEPRRGLFNVAFDKLGPRNADSVPLPLLILAGLSLLLIAGGTAGLLSRRLRARRAPTPAP